MADIPVQPRRGTPWWLWLLGLLLLLVLLWLIYAFVIAPDEPAEPAGIEDTRGTAAPPPAQPAPGPTVSDTTSL